MAHLEALTPPDDAARLGRRRFLAGAGAIAGASMLPTVLPEGVASAALPAGASQFRPLPNAERVADTREPSKYTYTRVSPTRIRIKVADEYGVPKSASAVVVTVTGVNFGLPNFVAAFPTSGSIPKVSNLNMLTPGETTANLATVRVGSGGQIDVYSKNGAHLIVDVRGYYGPVSGAVSAGRFVGLPLAKRVKDTRPNYAPTRSYTMVDVTSLVPELASSVVINLTATETTAPGYFTALPSDAPEGPKQPTSSLNVSRPGDTRAAGVIVPVRTIRERRQIKIFTLFPAKLIVDVVGYFTGDTAEASTDGLFVPVNPLRLLDTRLPTAPLGKLWPRWVVEVKLPVAIAPSAAAIVANVTGVESRGPGYLTVTGARQPVNNSTSNLNFSGAGQVVPNHVITPVTFGYGLQVFSSHGAHVLVDLAGYYTGKPKLQTQRYVNPPPPPAPPEWVLRIPRMGVTSRVMAGDPRIVTDTGHSWHWTGTGYMGQQGAHVSMFAHRTEAGAPYRNLDWMQNGDLFTITTSDRREYTYRVVRRDLTDANGANILAATRRHPGTTVSLIACTVGYDRSKSRWPDVWAPTSLKYRIIVTGEFVSWREF